MVVEVTTAILIASNDIFSMTDLGLTFRSYDPYCYKNYGCYHHLYVSYYYNFEYYKYYFRYYYQYYYHYHCHCHYHYHYNYPYRYYYYY